MQSPPLLSRPEKESGRGISKWPFILAGAVFVGLLVIGNLLVERSLPSEGAMPTRTTTEPLEVSLDISTTESAYPSEWAIYFDPTLMVLPNEQSFSRAYLLTSPRKQPVSVDLSVRSLPYEFKRPYFRAGGIVAPTKAGSWSKQDPTLVLEVRDTLPPEPPDYSVFGIYGEIQNRSVLSAPAFPTVKHTELLTPTEITIGVDSSGAVRMALLARSSGHEPTDELGLKLSRQASFAPGNAPTDRLSWGQLKIFWAVELKPTKL
jgi:hypothetical protein